MNHDVNLNIIHRFLAGECSAEEYSRVSKWAEADPANRHALDTLRKIWEVQPRKELRSDLRYAWQRLEEKLGQQKHAALLSEYKSCRKEPISIQKEQSNKGHFFSVYRFQAVAAVILIFLFTLFFIEFRNGGTAVHTEEVAMREVVTKRAHQAELTFSDGTRVVLNAASRIRFPERFVADVREVYLEGEAYFEVAHQAGTVFAVRTKRANVRVLGTKFNVKARPESQEAEVAVSEGKVSFQSKSKKTMNKNTGVILGEGQASTVREGKGPTPPRSIDIDHYLDWLRGDFVFDRQPFSEVIGEWKRRFDVDFVIEDSSLGSVLFTGEFSNESLEEMLRLASRSLEFQYHRNGQTITINKQ